MISTLENIRLKEGDKVIVSIAEGAAEVLDSSARSKIRVRLLRTGRELWIGRRAILDVVNES